MVRTARFLVVLCVVGGLVWTLPARAQWVENGAHIRSAAADQEFVPDGYGGAIITYTFEDDIYAQRINAYGYKLWRGAGVPICTAPKNQGAQAIAPDGAGGAIIAWQDVRNESYCDVYAQRIDADGNVLWAEDGVAVCVYILDQRGVRIVPDGDGGAIVAWHDYRNGFPKDIYAQRIDENGVARWIENGVGICTADNHQAIDDIVADGYGGAIVAWADYRDNSNECDIYAQRIDANGNAQWEANGRAVCMAPGSQYRTRIAMDMLGSIVITWDDNRPGMTGFDIYAQRLNMLGNPLWTADGIEICTQLDEQRYPAIVPDDEGGAIITWQDKRTGSNSKDIYAQRVNASGAKLWASWGVTVCSAASYQTEPVMVADGEGGAIIGWRDYRDLATYHIYAQRINSSGVGEWATDGVPVCDSNGQTMEIRATTDDAGGALFMWRDWRDESSLSLYAQRIGRSGNWVRPPIPTITAVQDVPRDQGGKISIQWERSYADTFPNPGVTHYSVWRRLPRAAYTGDISKGVEDCEPVVIPMDFAGPAIRMLGDAYAWEWLETVPARYFETYALTVQSLYDSVAADPGWQYFIVSAHAYPLSIYYDSPVDSGYSVDNLAPCIPQGFAGEQSHDPDGLMLSWYPNTETDISHYNLYRGFDGFMPGPDNFVAETHETAWFDGEWHSGSEFAYKLAAVDVHGNIGQPAVLRHDDIHTEKLLQSYAASLVDSWIEISWILSQPAEESRFFVLRSKGSEDNYTVLPSAEIEGEDLSFTFRDRTCRPGTAYSYRVEVADEGGRRILFDTDRILVPPMSLALHQNHPNPFNPRTSIRYYLPEKCRVTLDIYDISGRRIARLVDTEQAQGSYALDWLGLDEKGVPVSSGVYIYRLRAGKESVSRKMVLMR